MNKFYGWLVLTLIRPALESDRQERERAHKADGTLSVTPSMIPEDHAMPIAVVRQRVQARQRASARREALLRALDQERPLGACVASISK